MRTESTNNNGIEILIVEDSAIQSALLRYALAQKGYTVSSAKNGADALVMIREQKPTLIISDIMMPVMDGYEMCYQIKHDKVLKDIPVMLLTKLSDPQDVIRGINAKADYYVTKPYNNAFEFLLAKIEDLLSNIQLQKSENLQNGIRTYLDGKTHIINNSDLQQILHLLISIYDNAVQQHEELEKLADELKASETRYRAVLEHTFSGFYRATVNGKFLEVNPAYMRILGYDPQEKKELLDVDIPSTLYSSREEYEAFVEQLISEGALKNHVKHLRRKDAREVIVEENIHLIKDLDGNVQYFEGFVNDITERVGVEEMIRHQALHDALTDLPNRVLFTDRLNRALTNAHFKKQMLAVMFLDLDGFKRVNDTLGHDVGDQLLQAIANHLTNCVRKSDTVARMGGDEFTILLSEIAEAKNADMVAEKIVASFNEPWKLGDKECHTTSSIGIAVYPNDGNDAQALIKSADIAMYHAKTHGKNSYRRYLPSMKAEVKGE